MWFWTRFTQVKPFTDLYLPGEQYLVCTLLYSSGTRSCQYVWYLVFANVLRHFNFGAPSMKYNVILHRNQGFSSILTQLTKLVLIINLLTDVFIACLIFGLNSNCSYNDKNVRKHVALKWSKVCFEYIYVVVNLYFLYGHCVNLPGHYYYTGYKIVMHRYPFNIYDHRTNISVHHFVLLLLLFFLYFLP